MAEDNQTAHISTGNFKWGALGPRGRVVQDVSPPAPPLGPLENFAPSGDDLPDDVQKVFRGSGFNTIFRPQNFALSPTDVGGPVDPSGGDGDNDNDNILELNLTSERLAFSKALGSIPNRGAKDHNPDAFLNGVPYVQRINDVTDPNNPVGIHFEPGVWLAVPATDSPKEGPTFVRMASIPHGTTINAQGIAFNTIDGAPTINPQGINPFPIGNPAGNFRFPSQDVTKNDSARLPQNLTGIPITQAMLDDPNSVLRDRLAGQTVLSTQTLFVATNPPPPNAPKFGGGTRNIEFLVGDGSGPNADAVSMFSIFWIETVQEEIQVPNCKMGETVTVQGSGAGTDLSVSFYVTAPYDIVDECPIKVTYTQIQYSQVVILNFTDLSWPHVSVANLVPDAPIVVDASAFPAQAEAPATVTGAGD